MTKSQGYKVINAESSRRLNYRLGLEANPRAPSIKIGP